MPRRRSTAGRMDAAIDHFTPMGYNKTQVRSVVNALLKVYGREDGKQPWALLEDNCYQVVQDVLFEKQEEEEKLQLQVLQEQEQQSEEEDDVQEEGGAQQLLQEQQHEEDEEMEEEAPFEVPAVVGRTRPPCHGWIDESESDPDYEDHFGNRKREAPVPTPGGDGLCKTKRPSRWDVK